MNCVNPRRKLCDEIYTADATALLRFTSENLCSVSNVQGDEPPREAAGVHFQADARAHSGGEFTIARLAIRSGKTRVDRLTADIRYDEERRYGICFPVAGRLQAEQLTRTESCAPGSIIMMSGSEPFSLQSGHTEMFMLMLPQDFVEDRLVRAGDLCCRQVAKPQGVNALVQSMVIALQEAAPDLDENQLRKSVLIIGELLVLALGKLGDVKSTVSPVRYANLMRAKRIIREKCDDPDLTLADVAEECGLSLRYMHDLFRDDGRTFREYIMYERLQRARQMLEDGNTKVTDVCMASGFSNLSHFSTAFRRAFSVPPSKVMRRP